MLTKLQAEGTRDVRKMGGRYDEDQVAENKSQHMKIKRRAAPCCMLLIVAAKSKLLNEAVPVLIHASTPSLLSDVTPKRFKLFIFRTMEKLEQVLPLKMRAERSK